MHSLTAIVEHHIAPDMSDTTIHADAALIDAARATENLAPITWTDAYQGFTRVETGADTWRAEVTYWLPGEQPEGAMTEGDYAPIGILIGTLSTFYNDETHHVEPITKNIIRAALAAKAL